MDPAPSSEGGRLSFEEAEAVLLHTAEIELLGLLPNSTNYTFLARLSPTAESAGSIPQAPAEASARSALAVYKPAQGETPLWDFPLGTLHRREVAAYRLARFLGWPLIPPTVSRLDAPHGPGSLQLYIQAEAALGFFQVRDERIAELVPVALFDVITNNADRKAGHHLVDGEGRVWVIDHGLTFHPEPKLRTIIWDFAGQPLPDELAPDIHRALSAIASGELPELLAGLISPAELSLLRRRLRGVAEPDWRFPEPTSGWSVPWPPI